MFLLLLSSSYTESRCFLFLTPSHQWEDWGCTRSWEGRQLELLTPTDQRDILYHMTPCSAIKLGRKLAGGLWLRAWLLVSNCFQLHKLSFLVLFIFVVFLLITLLLFIYLFLLSVLIPTHEISHFYPSNSHLAQSTGTGKWASGRMIFSCQLRLNHDTPQLSPGCSWQVYATQLYPLSAFTVSS